MQTLLFIYLFFASLLRSFPLSFQTQESFRRIYFFFFSFFLIKQSTQNEILLNLIKQSIR